MNLMTSQERVAFKVDKHYLGTLCRRDHDAGGGQSWRHIGHGNCVECCRAGARNWRQAHPKRAAASTARRDANRPPVNRREKWPMALNVGSARARARARGLPFDLNTDSMKLIWRSQGGLCFWTGQALDFAVGDARHPMRPSIDRLIPSRGYVNGNVVWSSNFANRARSDLPAGQFAELLTSLGFRHLLDVKLAAAIASFGGR